MKYCLLTRDSTVIPPQWSDLVADSSGMDSRHYWGDENGGPVKYENFVSASLSDEDLSILVDLCFSSSDGYGRQADANLNFATGALASEDDGDYISSAYLKKGKVSRQDPMSHRIIEKRRRDRMNNCLADLSRLIPPDYCKKGRGRVEKTEIIEMAIRHLKYLQERSNGIDSRHQEGPISVEHFRLGYQECRSEVMRYLVEAQGYLPTDTLCVHLVGHLNRHCDSIMKGDQLNQPRSNPETTSSSSGSSGNYGGDKQSVIALAHRAPAHESSNNYHKRLYEPAAAAPAPPYAPSPDLHDDYITLPYYTEDADAPLPLTRAPPPHEQPNLRSVRKLERDDFADHVHSYKFKNTIKQRFSQDCDEAHDMTLPAKRRRPVKQDSTASTATSFTSSNDEGVCRDASPEPLPTDEPRGLPPHLTPEPPPKSERERGLHIPVFALHSVGKYYVPLNVSYDCLSTFVGPYDLLRCSGATNAAPLHPVSINVNFQPFIEHVKPKTEEGRKWRPA